jgi:hypothetical protein
VTPHLVSEFRQSGMRRAGERTFWIYSSSGWNENVPEPVLGVGAPGVPAVAFCFFFFGAGAVAIIATCYSLVSRYIRETKRK